MKYIISESRLDNLIDKFLTFQFESNEEILLALENGVFPIKKNIIYSLMRAFSLNYEDAFLYVKLWLKKHYNLDFDDLIYKFLTSKFEPHEEIEHAKNMVSWKQDGKRIAAISNNVFRIDLKTYYSFIKAFSLEYEEAFLYIKSWLKKHYNLDIVDIKDF